LEGLAQRSGIKCNLDLRVAEHQNDIWIDLCDDSWKAVRLNASGWEIVDTPPVIFKRYKHMLPLEIDRTGTGEDFDKFQSLINFQSPEDRLLHTGFVFQEAIPNIDRPVLVFAGPQGSAKTTSAEMTRIVFDPSSIATFNMNSDVNELPQKILHHWIPTFDNCNHISQEISDLLCQSSSGMGFSKRKLFTDMDDVICSVKRSLILDGISSPSMAPDFLDRTTIVRLERITNMNRREREEINKIRDSLLPKVRGFILNTISAALADPYVYNGSLPRLAGYAKIVDRCTTKIGYKPGEFVTTYIYANKEIAEEAIRADPVSEALLRFLDNKETWTGAASNLLDELTLLAGQAAREQEFPKGQNALSEALFGRLKPGLTQLGYQLSKNRTASGRTITISKLKGGLGEW